jgi:hypothetical protein
VRAGSSVGIAGNGSTAHFGCVLPKVTPCHKRRLIADGSKKLSLLEAANRGDALDQGDADPLHPGQVELRFGGVAGRGHPQPILWVARDLTGERLDFARTCGAGHGRVEAVL